MRIELVHVDTRSSGVRTRRSETFEGPVVRFGRGTDNEIHLNDLAVPLHQGSFAADAEGFVATASDAHVLLVNGRPVHSARLAGGDRLRLGSYELRVIEASAGAPLQVEIERVERSDDGLAGLEARTRLGSGWLTRRRLSWALGVGVLAGWGALPLLADAPPRSWSSGPVASVHATLAADCEACHARPFEPVADTACRTCHPQVGEHGSTQAVATHSARQARCASCHREHQDDRDLATLPGGLCSDCHARLETIVPDTILGNASDFGRHHPELRLALPADPDHRATRRTAWSPVIEERSGLAFDHFRHVGQLVVDVGSGEKRHLRCDACHTPEPGGHAMEPVSFDVHCRSCHGLVFDEAFPERQAVHASLEEVRADLTEFYAWHALGGGADRGSGVPALVRGVPDAPLEPAKREAALAWAEEAAQRAETHLLSGDEHCAQCHRIEVGDGGPRVAPVHLTRRWLPASDFSHAGHSATLCARCHVAAAAYDPNFAPSHPKPDWAQTSEIPFALHDVAELAGRGLRPSRRSADVLVPGIETCRGCHGGANAPPPRVASDCGLCHAYHADPSRPLDAAAPAADRLRASR